MLCPYRATLRDVAVANHPYIRVGALRAFVNSSSTASASLTHLLSSSQAIPFGPNRSRVVAVSLTRLGKGYFFFAFLAVFFAFFVVLVFLPPPVLVLGTPMACSSRLLNSFESTPSCQSRFDRAVPKTATKYPPA